MSVICCALVGIFTKTQGVLCLGNAFAGIGTAATQTGINTYICKHLKSLLPRFEVR